MPGNASIAEQSSIGQSPKIGGIASPPKPRKKSKQTPCHTGAERYRNSGIAYVRFGNGRTGVLGYVPGEQTVSLSTRSLSAHSTLVHRFTRSFISISRSHPAQPECGPMRYARKHKSFHPAVCGSPTLCAQSDGVSIGSDCMMNHRCC